MDTPIQDEFFLTGPKIRLSWSCPRIRTGASTRPSPAPGVQSPREALSRHGRISGTGCAEVDGR